MPPRVVLVSGDRAVPLAAATARDAAAAGQRTLLVAAADPYRRADALAGAPLGLTPVQLRPGLHAVRLDPQQAFADAAERLLARAKPLFELLGVEPLDRDELSALPGAAHLALLDALRRYGGDASDEAAGVYGWEQVVVAAPPVPELLAALALPEQLDHYLARLLPGEERQAARALRPMLAGLAGVPMPADWLFTARAWASGQLAEVHAVLDRPGTSVRLALDAPDGPQALAALDRDRAGLALYGRRVDALLVDRVLEPAAAQDHAVSGRATLGQAAVLGELIDAQQAALARLRRDWDVPVLALPHTGPAPAGLDDLPHLPPVPLGADDGLAAGAEGAGGSGGAGALLEPWVEDRLYEPPHVLVWHLPLPGAQRGELELLRRGDDLVVGVAGYRRTLLLPSALRRCTVAGAALRDGVLAVRFAPDPQLWPR